MEPARPPGSVQTLAYALRDLGAYLLCRLAIACLQDGARSPPVSGDEKNSVDILIRGGVRVLRRSQDSSLDAGWGSQTVVEGRRGRCLSACTRGETMKSCRSRGVLVALVALLGMAAGLPPRAGAFCNGSFFITQHGFCSISTTQACGIPSLGDAECPAGETCVNDPRVVSFINPCSPSASPPCNSATAQARIKLDVGAGPISASPFQLTVNRLRFDLDCVGSPSLPCTDQGDIVRYLGDTTITSNCTVATGNVTWVSTTAQGGNEIVFNPTDGSGNPRPLLINQNTAPGDTTGGGCSVFFNIQVVSQEPASGPLSDNTPGEIEQIAGYTTTSNDATCAVNQPSGSQQTNNIPICPSCTVDDCNLGCDQTTGTCTPKGDSTPCTDSDNDLCTTAGCELNAAGVGVCLQTHKQKTDGTVDECNMDGVGTTGTCTAKEDSTPCTDNDNDLCTTAGCEKNAGGVGQCVQTHRVNPGGTHCANPIVGAATDCTVLSLDGGSVSVTGPPGGIVGDVCIGPNGKLSITGSEFVTGEVRLSAGATFSKSGSGTVGSVETGQDLSAEINAAFAAAANAASQACTVNLTSIKSSTTTNATGGGTVPTVVCVGDVVLNGAVVRLQGVTGDSFIINVTGKFVLNGGSRIIASGIQPKDVLYNIIGSGEQVAFTGGGGGSGCCKSSVDGTLLAPNRNVALSPGLVNGELIGGRNISIVSGSSVKCPPAPCVP